MTTDYVGSELMEPDGYLQPRGYKITAHCHRCGNDFSWTAKNMAGKDRPCPRKACREAVFQEAVLKEARNLAKILEEQRPPGHIGDKPVVRAIDETARIVMEDHHLTDLRDNIRPGESMAPKLPGDQQEKADNFFNSNALASKGLPSRAATLLGRRAIAGAFRATAVNPSDLLRAQPGERAPIQTLVRTEKIG